MNDFIEETTYSTYLHTIAFYNLENLFDISDDRKLMTMIFYQQIQKNGPLSDTRINLEN